MSRRGTITIKEIVDLCQEYKAEMNKFKKLSAPLETQIKEYALKNGVDKIKSDKWQANISVKPNQDFNEEKAIKILKNNLDSSLLDSIVKKKEYIDEDALEKAIYNGDIKAKLLASCTIEKEPTIRLTIGKIK